jgi:hypothetical protein
MIKRLSCLVVAVAFLVGGFSLPAVASEVTSNEASETQFEPVAKDKKGKGKGKGKKKGKGKGKGKGKKKGKKAEEI